MSNGAFIWDNIFDDATVTASSEETNMPATNLQIEHIQSRKWRGSNGATESILATYAANQSADTFMLNGLGSDLSINAMTSRLRLSSADATGAAGDRYDTNTSGLDPAIDANYAYLIHVLPTVVTGWKYARWDLTLTSAAYIEASRGAISTRTQLDYNPVVGARRAWRDRSIITESDDFQQFVDRRSKYREWEMTLEGVSAELREELFEAMAMHNGIQTDVLFMSNPDSTNLGRDSIWGLMQEVPPIIFPHGVDIYSTSVSIRERR